MEKHTIFKGIRWNSFWFTGALIKLLWVISGLLTFWTLFILMFMGSCANDDTDAAVDCSGVSVSFTTDVSPIIQASCATNSRCHGSGSNNGPGELLTYSQVYSARTSIRSSVSSGEMPKDGTLSTDEKNTILCWIENGASSN